MHPRLRLALALGGVLLLAACAAGSPDSHQTAHGGVLSLLVLGFWHGLIAPVILIIEIIQRFLPGVLPIPQQWHIYETAAASVPYDVGFYFGLGGGPIFAYSRWR